MAQETTNIYEELAPFARLTVVPGVSVGQLSYVNQQDLVYTCAITPTLSVDPDLDGRDYYYFAANTTAQFFQGTLGDSATAAGYSAGTLSNSQTNSRFPRGQAPANQAFVATGAGFSVTTLARSGQDLSATNLNQNPLESQLLFPEYLYQLAHQFSWDLTIGRGITRTIGTLATYCGSDAVTAVQNDAGDFARAAAAGKGVPGSSQLGRAGTSLTKLKVPIVFPPLVNVAISAQNGSPFRICNTASAFFEALQIRLTLRGYLMTMPVG